MLFLTAAIAAPDFEPAAWQAVESLLQRAEQVQVSNDSGQREDANLDSGLEMRRPVGASRTPTQLGVVRRQLEAKAGHLSF